MQTESSTRSTISSTTIFTVHTIQMSCSAPTTQIPLPYFPSLPRSSSCCSEDQPLKKQRKSLLPVPKTPLSRTPVSRTPVPKTQVSKIKSQVFRSRSCVLQTDCVAVVPRGKAKSTDGVSNPPCSPSNPPSTPKTSRSFTDSPTSASVCRIRHLQAMRHKSYYSEEE